MNPRTPGATAVRRAPDSAERPYVLVGPGLRTTVARR
ncbi:hypothetical protein Ae406Ps2_0946 [Pseudonocardia sp. Ae406_Ps2]|nr:hypothetical protein Ae406Ps2_0946 [Pseudonocardia sp. Ae406_Ps2]OLM07259.1 hypothetical protein Ae331Ps2_4969c [Pseudonocardia sp. Ae331_Ps2]OLM14451.1 hypothetical protein Ae505Ps2_4581c [Pseudonocardia sp. Ae505_Ps2]OLM22524.1 hypothetical protein Ae706Ps2_0956 [Pseudonocardia sp. Ae706_Ps2]